MKVFGKGVCMYGVCVMEECGEFVYHAYVLQGGGGGDETMEMGMKLTRICSQDRRHGVREWNNKRERGGSVSCIHVLVSRRCNISCNGL